MSRYCLLCVLLSATSLSAQTSPWSSTVELGWNSGRDLGYVLRLNHTIPAGKRLEVVFSTLIERGVVETAMTAGDAFEFSGGVSEAFLPKLTSFELRSGVGVGLRRSFEKFVLGCSVRSVWRINRDVTIDLPNQFTVDGLPRTTRNIRYFDQFDPSPEVADSYDLLVSGDRLRLQAGLEAGVKVGPSLELSLLYRYDAFGRNEQRIDGIGGFRPDPNMPVNLFRGVSRGHYLMAGLTVHFK